MSNKRNLEKFNHFNFRCFTILHRSNFEGAILPVILIQFFWILTRFCVLVQSAPILDELISARCHAKCLSEFEALALSQDVPKRQLKHSIIQLCKSNATCNSCGRPCREPFDGLLQCYSDNCKDALSMPSCYRSCQFMREATTHKPGSCKRPPMQDAIPGFATECVVSCSRDGDCSDSQKCCDNGCGKSCSEPVQKSLLGLLPIPTDVAVAERRRGRSVTIRWVMSQLKPEHESTVANLYVVQWKWGIRPEEQHMTKWQTISIRNKLYAILKHLLTPGMYYRFRLAAVNVNGSLGFSKESDSFRLAKSPRAPGKPQQLELGSRSVAPDGLLTQEIRWRPPNSDFPILEYHISWMEIRDENNNNEGSFPYSHHFFGSDDGHTVLEPAKLVGSGLKTGSGTGFQISDGNNNNNDYNDENVSEFLDAAMTKSVPGTANSAILDSLISNSNFLVSVSAIVEIDEDKLAGTKAILKFTTQDLKEQGINLISTAAKSRASYSDSQISSGGKIEPTGKQEPSIRDIFVETPLVLGTSLTAFVRWKISHAKDEKLYSKVSCRAESCASKSSSKSNSELMPPRNDKTLTTEGESMLLKDLHFDCTYVLSISLSKEIDSKHHELVDRSFSELRFKTPPCADFVKTLSPNFCDSYSSPEPVLPSVPAASVLCQPAQTSFSSFTTSKSSNSHVQFSIQSEQATSSSSREHFDQSVPRSHQVSFTCSWLPPVAFQENLVGYRFLMTWNETKTSSLSKIVPSVVQQVTFNSLRPKLSYTFQVQVITAAGLGPAVEAKFLTPNQNNELSENSINSDIEESKDLKSADEIGPPIDAAHFDFIDQNSIDFDQLIHKSSTASLSIAKPQLLLIASFLTAALLRNIVLL